ncbi:MAG: ABC transporter substrate-binding protein [Bacillota bacterium]
MPRRFLALLAAALLSATLLGACGKAKAPAEADPVRFTAVIHSVFYAPQYVAQAKGFFKDEGIALTASTAQGSDRGVAALLAGTADIALVGPETTIFVHNQDSPVKVKLFAQLTARDGSFLVARQRPAGEFAWSDLKSKSVIGWRPGSMPQLVAAATFLQQGLNPEGDLTYISNIAAPAMVGAFQSGTGDYVQLFEPLVSQLEQAGQGHVVASFGEAYGDMPYTGFVATDKYIAEHPEIVQRYTNAIYRAMRYVFETDPVVVAEEIAPLFDGANVDLLASAIHRYRETGAWKTSPVMVPADFEKLQDLMVQGGVLEPSKRAPFDAIATNEFANKAVEQAK